MAGEGKNKWEKPAYRVNDPCLQPTGVRPASCYIHCSSCQFGGK